VKREAPLHPPEQLVRYRTFAGPFPACEVVVVRGSCATQLGRHAKGGRISLQYCPGPIGFRYFRTWCSMIPRPVLRHGSAPRCNRSAPPVTI